MSADQLLPRDTSGKIKLKYPTLQSVVTEARRKSVDSAWDYLIGGTETETTVARNRAAYDALALKPRVLRDMRNVDCASTFFGHPTRLPVALAPMGSIDMLHPEGALPVATAAEAFGVVSYLSSSASPGIDIIADQTSHPKVFQLYIRGDSNWVDEYIQRAIDLGYIAVCITVDLAVYSRRERDRVKGFVPTARRRDNLGREFQARFSWDDLKRVKDKFDIPVFAKGIGSVEDAVLACEHGCEVVYLSNHGGRALDHAPGTLSLLPATVDAVGGRAEIVVDGGILRGTDVIKALALGASSVAIGRLHGYGLAADGHEGILRVLELLEEEMLTSLALLGVSALDRLGREHVAEANPVVNSSALSAFPFLDIS